MIDLEQLLVTPDFDDETHIYRMGGRIVPGVSTILRKAGIADPAETDSGFVISDDIIDNAADRGKVIHAAIELLDAGELDWETVDDECLPYVEAWQAWCEATGFVSIANEWPFYDETHDYCGTGDAVGYIGDRLTIVDRKTGSAGLKPWHKYQLAAYAWPFSEWGDKWPQRIMVQLKANGKPKAVTFAANGEWDMKVFLACRTLLTAKELDRKC